MSFCHSCDRDMPTSWRGRNCADCQEESYARTFCVCGEPKAENSSICRTCLLTCADINKTGRFINKGGYAMVRGDASHPRCKGGKYVAEHTLVMEKFLGRYLTRNETVHHLNGIRDDNRIENLELWCKPQATGIRASDALAWAREIIALYGNEPSLQVPHYGREAVVIS